MEVELISLETMLVVMVEEQLVEMALAMLYQQVEPHKVVDIHSDKVKAVEAASVLTGVNQAVAVEAVATMVAVLQHLVMMESLVELVVQDMLVV